jgi:autotransporter-associated beta strand protein
MASNTNWTNTSGGSWFTGSNWDNGTPAGNDAYITAAGAYVVTIDNSATASSLTFDAANSELVEAGGGSLNVAGFFLQAGRVVLSTQNTFNSVIISGGLLEFSVAGALGSANTVSLDGGELLATATQALGNSLVFQSNGSTLAAAHGTTLTLNGAININSGATATFGAFGQDGAIVWNATNTLGSIYTIHVRAGTLKAGNANFSNVLANDAFTVLDAGATIDVAGFATTINDLQGGGAIIDSGGADTLTLKGAPSNPVFSGVISGAQSLVVNGAVYLTGANTYSGSTEVKSGGGLSLGNFGATGSIAAGGAILLDSGGTLFIARSNAVTLANAISGFGVLQQTGTGVTTINRANNAFSGITAITQGTLAIGNGAALGTGGTLYLVGGELLGTTTETFGNTITFDAADETAAIAAAHGTALTLTGNFAFDGSDTIDIGAAGQDGDVVWSSSLLGPNSNNSLDVMDGTLTAGSNALSALTAGFAETIVEAGATLDWAGHAARLNNLQGSGTVTSNGAADTLFLQGGVNFAGVILGQMALDLTGDGLLSGTQDYRGPTTLHGVTTLSLAGTFDDTNNNDFFGDPSSSMVNNGLFEKTGAAGHSFVNTSFVNNGTINVISGSVTFDDGFVNHGVIHGLVTHSGGVTTISAPVHEDFNGKGQSGIVWSNASGDTAIWSSNGVGGFTSKDLSTTGSGFQAAGVGDFNGDGEADILWSNAGGDALIYNSNGAGGFTPEDLHTTGSGWSVAGVGDFNADGKADILWSNAGGDALIYNSNGAGGFTPQDLHTAGSGWSVAGIGDFNGDGKADILWSNASGDALIYNSNGAGGFTPQDLHTAGSGWSVAGIGDFNGDGKADILWSNASGDALIYNSNGAGGFTPQDLHTAGSGWTPKNV